MGLVGFLNFGLKCIQLLAWPSFALVYPLCASIRAIETNSNYHMRKLVTYWILFSLISLFEHAFAKLIEWVPFWPYLKIIAICCLVIPRFNGAFITYKCLVSPCLSMPLHEVVINLLNKKQDISVKGETFLAVAERYVNENGTEALEKLIASKGATKRFDVEEIKSVGAGEKEELATSIQGATQRFDMEIKSVAAGEEKEVTTLVQPTSKQPMVVQKDIKAVEILEENAAAAQIRNVDTSFPQTEKKSSTSAEVENTTLPASAVGENELPIPPALKKAQKEWTCAVCQVTTQSEITLNSHLQGIRHRSKCEELQSRKQSVKNESPPSTTGNNLDQSKQSPKKSVPGGEINKNVSPKTEEKVKANANNSPSQPTKPKNTDGGIKRSKYWCGACNITFTGEAYMMSHLNGRKHLSHVQDMASSSGLAYWCSICGVKCQSEATIASHLKGRKHMAQLQNSR